MKTIPKLSIALSFFLISGCGVMTRDFATWNRNYEHIDLSELEIGESQDDVQEKLGKPANVIGARQFERGLVEVWAYERWVSQIGYDYKEREHWLYFMDQRLVQWGDPGNWESEAKRIYEIRIR